VLSAVRTQEHFAGSPVCTAMGGGAPIAVQPGRARARAALLAAGCQQIASRAVPARDAGSARSERRAQCQLRRDFSQKIAHEGNRSSCGSGAIWKK
jgi:hypothetical protein